MLHFYKIVKKFVLCYLDILSFLLNINLLHVIKMIPILSTFFTQRKKLFFYNFLVFINRNSITIHPSPYDLLFFYCISHIQQHYAFFRRMNISPNSQHYLSVKFNKSYYLDLPQHLHVYFELHELMLIQEKENSIQKKIEILDSTACP